MLTSTARSVRVLLGPRWQQQTFVHKIVDRAANRIGSQFVLHGGNSSNARGFSTDGGNGDGKDSKDVDRHTNRSKTDLSSILGGNDDKLGKSSSGSKGDWDDADEMDVLTALITRKSSREAPTGRSAPRLRATPRRGPRTNRVGDFDDELDYAPEVEMTWEEQLQFYRDAGFDMSWEENEQEDITQTRYNKNLGEFFDDRNEKNKKLKHAHPDVNPLDLDSFRHLNRLYESKRGEEDNPHLPAHFYVFRDGREVEQDEEYEETASLEEKTERIRKVDDQGRAYGTGRRKNAVARVWVKEGTGNIVINNRSIVDYFPRAAHRDSLLEPFFVTSTTGKFDVWCTATGGGLTGQAGAIRMGISRALQNFDPEHRPAMKRYGLLRRDSRMVERKKPGLVKARKAPQWVKR